MEEEDFRKPWCLALEMGTGMESCVSNDQRGQQPDEMETLLLEVRAGPVVKLLSSHVGRNHHEPTEQANR